MTKTKSKNKKITVLGYGSQGRAIALNLNDSGFDINIGLSSKSSSRRKAKKDGLTNISTTAKAVRESNIIILALPDHLQAEIYKNEIEPNLNENSTLIFLHGLSIHFKYIIPPKNSDIILIAPHAPGISVREKYLSEQNLSAFYAVYQNYSKNALKTVFEISRALGFKKSKLVKTTFEHEAVGDLFGEQAVLCGGLSELIMNGYKILTEKGIPPENAYLEVAYQLDLIIDLIKKYGIKGMYERISVAARYGSVLNGEKIIDKSVKNKMNQLYKEISSGEFSNKLNSLSEKELQKLNKKIDSKTISSFENAAKKFSRKS